MTKLLAATAVVAAFSFSAMTQAQTAPGDAVTVIHAGQLLDRPGERPRGQSTITVRNGRIVSVTNGFAPAEPGTRVIDLRDRFVMPGMIDSHVHITGDVVPNPIQVAVQSDPEDAALRGVALGERTLQAGFTTIRTMSGGTPVRALRDAIARGRIPGPTILHANNMISVSSGHGDANGFSQTITDAYHAQMNGICNGADSCRAAVRAQVQRGADVIKVAATGGVTSNIAGGLNQQMTDEELKAVIDTAHSFGRKVAVHAHAKTGIEAALRAGADSIEHASFTDDETIALFKKSGAYLVPTLVTSEAAERDTRSGALSAASAAKAKEVFAVARKNVARAVKAGVKIAFGTDAPAARHGENAREFRLLIGLGLTPSEAIRSATVNAADLLGRSASIGTIEPNKDADIIAVEGSPLEDVSRLERVDFVMRQGTVHKLRGEPQPFRAN